MDIKFGLKVFSAAAVLTLAGCMTSQDRDAARANAGTLQFADQTAASLAKTVVAQQGGGQANISDLLRQAGVCQKFVDLATDLEDCSKLVGGKSQCEDALPPSILEFVDCFGLNISGDGDINDIDTVSASLRDFQKFQGCVCGGSGTFGSIDHLKWQTFSASASANAGAAFQGSNSSVTGDAYNGSNSSVSGNAYTGSQSTIAKPYSGK